MNNLRQVALGLLAALVSAAILMGSLALALAEGGLQTAQLETTPSLVVPLGFPTLTPTPGQSNPIPGPGVQTATLISSVSPSQTSLPSLTPSLTLSPSAPALTATKTPQLGATVCPMPYGWSVVTVRPGDTLESLAKRYNTTPQALAQANCLVGTTLFPGSQLYVPAPPRVQPTIPCGPPSGWVLGYTVAHGDTLYHISRMFGITVYQLQLANCMQYSTLLQPGERLYVPYVPTNTPFVPTSTLTPVPPSPTATPSPSATDTQPPVPTQTDTPVPTQPPTLPPTAPPTSPPTAPPVPPEPTTEVPVPTINLPPVPTNPPTGVPLIPTEIATPSG